jgi:serine/threonine protein phosphatase 1
MRHFAIGDIHGCLDALERLDRELRFRASDTVITLGDYVDRGPDSSRVIDYLLALRKRCNLVALRGNHEIMMIRARVDRACLMNWISCGGDRTLDSYGAATFDDIPQSHWKFLEETIPFHESGHDFFVHANACPDLPLADQPFDMLFWEPFGEPGPHQSGRRMICGHTSQKSGRPLDIGHAVCIDTYAHGGGWLTCLETQTDVYWQATQKGELRHGSLRSDEPA